MDVKELGSFQIGTKPETVPSPSAVELIVGNILFGCCAGFGMILGIAAGISFLEVFL